ncbi:MAG: DOMON domain-containing protein [candidate division WOR-3 bacterium]|nr:DOMON domain-containing protein [candidate division WOR-3 bacterium]
MKWLKIFSIIIIGFSFIWFSNCNTKEQEQGNGNNADTLRTITTEGITLQWKPDSVLLSVKVIAPTTGWVAVGFDPTQGMKDANIIIGYVHNDTAYVRDEYGSGPTTHASDVSADGTDDVTEIAGNETQDNTEINFKIPLDSGDSRDRPLIVGNSYNIILAYGQNGADNFDSYHKTRVVVNIKI